MTTTVIVIVIIIMIIINMRSSISACDESVCLPSRLNQDAQVVHGQYVASKFCSHTSALLRMKRVNDCC